MNNMDTGNIGKPMSEAQMRLLRQLGATEEQIKNVKGNMHNASDLITKLKTEHVKKPDASPGSSPTTPPVKAAGQTIPVTPAPQRSGLTGEISSILADFDAVIEHLNLLPATWNDIAQEKMVEALVESATKQRVTNKIADSRKKW